MDKNYCFIISSMRSGSTLLKALIATRPDCTDLPETPFVDYNSVHSDKRIIVLKKPAGFDNFEYPNLASVQSKKIVLIRNPHDTVCSLLDMFNQRNRTNSVANNLVYLISYWYMVYNNIIEKKVLERDAIIVRYEDLLDQPIEETARIFQFIGTDFPEGTDSYRAPSDYTWTWSKDDGGEIIKTLSVQKNQKQTLNNELREFISSSKEIQCVLSYFGYNTPDTEKIR